MKRTQSVLAALMLTAAAGMPLARAADISQGVQTLDISHGSATFKHEFGDGNAGNTFSDRYDFTARAGQALGLLVSSLDLGSLGLGGAGLDSVTVYNSAGFSLDGHQQSMPGAAAELWTLSAHHLAADSYYLLVSGTVRNVESGSYVGSLAVSPAPEPASYGMLLGGLGVVGWAARRRRAGRSG